jgi:dihydroorotase
MKYDLLLTGGDVLDPAAGLRGIMDIGIAGGKIISVAASLPAHEARRTISAKGRLVTPGLIDMHAHVFVNTHDMGGRTDCICQASGVTTLCDAGSSGSATFAGMRRMLDNEVRTRVRALVICRPSASSARRVVANWRICRTPTPKAARGRSSRTLIWRSA